MRTLPPSRLEAFTFFLDRNLGRHIIADALRQAGAQVEIHDDHFAQDTLDEDWLLEVGRRGWIVLTKDARIRYRAHERDALIRAGVSAFVLVGKNLSAPAMAEILVRSLPKILRFAERHQPPFIAKITRSGAVSRLMMS